MMLSKPDCSVRAPRSLRLAAFGSLGEFFGSFRRLAARSLLPPRQGRLCWYRHDRPEPRSRWRTSPVASSNQSAALGPQSEHSPTTLRISGHHHERAQFPRSSGSSVRRSAERLASARAGRGPDNFLREGSAPEPNECSPRPIAARRSSGPQIAHMRSPSGRSHSARSTGDSWRSEIEPRARHHGRQVFWSEDLCARSGSSDDPRATRGTTGPPAPAMAFPLGRSKRCSRRSARTRRSAGPGLDVRLGLYTSGRAPDDERPADRALRTVDRERHRRAKTGVKTDTRTIVARLIKCPASALG